ncbi:uncharacterized protein EV420DRAFT_1636544 [Desarmillaria tabescens]|uniref:hAT-like transposase RNase-H fold domain-containing protein n=1 Tax=Armillaria tabescens TaxID=1929756 RepID=A0AA39NHY8_ARMTA|nr:uncharacterized protein EV420DRAFT_1636544 [Desarmillaria tabescens]KAK0465985.1 hypothetical protein EV420DRAFT_1636544 [Desarmillaria tabescens]
MVGVVEEFLLDFIHLTDSHTGEYLTHKFVEVLNDFGIAHKALRCVADNAEVNAVMVHHAQHQIPTFKGPKYHVNCQNHIWALCIKFAAIKGEKITEDDNEQTDEAPADEIEPKESEANHEIEEYLDQLVNEVEQELEVNMDESRPVVTEEEAKVGRYAIHKLTQLRKKGFHNSLLRLYLHDILDDICDQIKFNQSRGLHLWQYTLSNEEWEVLDQCSDYLELFKHAIFDFLKSGKPLIFKVFPAIDKLTRFLEQGQNNKELHATVRMACYHAMLVLNKYYAKTDESVIYHIAMIMHPGYKLQYFHSQNWLKEWIDDVVNVLCQEWNDYQPQNSSSVPASQPTQAQKDKKKCNISWDSSPDETAVSSRVTSDVDPLDKYLYSPVLQIKDPLKYWESQDPESNLLAQFALDFLSMSHKSY